MTKNNGKKIAVAYADVPSDAPPDEKDVLIEVDCVFNAIAELGYEPVRLPFSFNVIKVIENLQEIKPLLVFNLVESLLGKGAFIHIPLLVFEYLKLRYTGSGSETMYLTSNKIMTKTILSSHDIPTPPWQTLVDVLSEGVKIETPFIMKPVCEDASVDITDASIFYKAEALLQEIAQMEYNQQKEYFIEQFVEGREINISLLADKNMPIILPPSEIIFQDFPENKPKIVGYDAKWNENSFEYKNTPRSFDFSSEDISILGRMEKLAIHCWQVLALQGYARVDFRIDRNGKPWVLEANANPCLSPDSGFIAAAGRARIRPYEKIIKSIIEDGLQES